MGRLSRPAGGRGGRDTVTLQKAAASTSLLTYRATLVQLVRLASILPLQLRGAGLKGLTDSAARHRHGLNLAIEP